MRYIIVATREKGDEKYRDKVANFYHHCARIASSSHETSRDFLRSTFKVHSLVERIARGLSVILILQQRGIFPITLFSIARFHALIVVL